MKSLMVWIAVLGLVGMGDAAAHGPMAAQFGGQMVETADGVRVELVVRQDGIRVWVRDHNDQPESDVSGKATVLVDTKKLDLSLRADAGAYVAAGQVSPTDRVTTILNLTVKGKPLSVRFAQAALVQPAALSPQAQNGKTVFQAVCASCHGGHLRGSDNGPPLLHEYYSPNGGHGDQVILSAINNGAASHHWKFGDMPKPPGIAPGQDQAVLAYIRAMQAANGFAADGAAPPMAGMGGMNHQGH